MFPADPQRLSDDQLESIFRDCRTIAVVGLSANPSRPSHMVASYLAARGYEVIPVNPSLERVMDRTCYPDLRSVPVKIDVVDVFRRSEFMPDIAREAAEVGARVLWMQQGVYSQEAVEIAHTAGMSVMEDACIKIEHHRLAANL